MAISPSSLAAQAPAWSDVLDRVQETLTHTLTDTTRREQALKTTEAASLTGLHQPEGWRQVFACLDEGQEQFLACVQKAQEVAGKADADLAAAEEHFRNWLKTAQAIREKLVKEGLSSV